jgi:hypothetical protein
MVCRVAHPRVRLTLVQAAHEDLVAALHEGTIDVALSGLAVLPARHGGPLTGSVEVPVAPRTCRHIGLLSSTRRTLEPAAERFRQWAAQHAGNGRSPVPARPVSPDRKR